MATLTISGKEYKVHPKVMKLLDSEEGVHYRNGKEVKGKGGDSIFVTCIKTLKKKDSDFERMLISIYTTTAGEMLFRDGIDIEGVNPSLGKLK